MMTEIGIVAGEIWHYLDSHGEVKLSRMVTDLERSRDLTLMSLGWLAREGHAVLVNCEGDYKITLRK